MSRTKEEIEKQIQEIDEAMFMNNMNDHWTDWNYKRDSELRDQKRNLEKELEALNEQA